MGKYEPLARYLKSRTDDSWNATFADVERHLGQALPASARDHRAWWANQTDGNHSQARGWQEAGWETREVNLGKGLVRFERRSSRYSIPPPPAPAHAETLLDQAQQATGIVDREQLISEALQALIQREATKQLIALGGSMPDFSTPPRERPDV